MNTVAIDTSSLSDNNTFQFKKQDYIKEGFIDVIYKGQRIAILNGFSAPLQWTAKNGSNIPVKVIDQLEKMVVRLISKTQK